MSDTTIETPAPATADQIEEVAARLQAAERQARSWLARETEMSAEEALGDLVHGFPSAEALLGSKLDRAAAVRLELEAALAAARAVPAASPPPAPVAPTTLRELEAREQAVSAGRAEDWSRGELRIAIDRAERLVPILRAGVQAFAAVTLTAFRDLVVARQQAEVDRLAATLAELRRERHAVRELATAWTVALDDLPKLPGLTHGR